MKIKLIVVTALFGVYSISSAQDKSNTVRKEEKKFINWHNLDPVKNKVVGISVNRTYNELLKNKNPTSVIVAVIDGGVDINHEDLKNRIWVNNGEIPGNGIDDDKNGFIDDIHGWNFIGSPDGRNIGLENLEITRLYRDYSKLFEGKDSATFTDSEKILFKEYKKIKIKFTEKYSEAKTRYENFLSFRHSYHYADSLMQFVLGKKDYTLRDLKRFKPRTDNHLKDIKNLLLRITKKGYTRSELEDYAKYLDTRYLYHYNLDFNPREIVGDDYRINTGTVYGNNDVVGPDPDHGTFVSGIIAGERNNGIGINGILDSVRIMVLRTVPDGDEYDKDVANAIIYAVNNGAQIINCSFGKIYSPQKQFVDSALKLAQERGVLIIHAAGNDAENNDIVIHYPYNMDSFGNKLIDNWITVGATSRLADENMVASFSNYGKLSVDLFAPGHRIYSTMPGNTYSLLDGTSFSSPIVCGTAALLKSFYPSLSASQIKEILLQSGTKFPNLYVNLPNEEKFKQKSKKVLFSSLSITGGIVNIYNAIKLAEQYPKN